MRADNTAPLISAARRRSELTRAKAIRALRELDHAGTPVTFQTAARAAGVSRSWLYTQADIRTEIERLRDATQRAPSPPIPARQHASDASLRQRLAEANNRNRQLAQENQRLRRQLAHALGDQRAAWHTVNAPGPTETRHTPITITPP
jgi:small-conductance mechanosensitive channel